ncbi:MAG: hypothetical protein JWO12_1720 [Frankiales bacterium]|nr:hypothetical protein [Frankiales bacterium]
MLRATLKSLLARKLRLMLASLAVLLGISFMSGALVLTDSLGRVFDNLFTSISSGTDVQVQGTSALGADAQAQPVPQAALDAVKKVDGVAEVVGDTGGEGGLVLPNGKLLKKTGPPVLGVSFNAGGLQESLRVKQGKAPVGLDQVAIDLTTARKQHLKIGEQVGITGTGPKRPATITGFVGFDTTNSIAGATLLAFDPPSAQQLFGHPGEYQSLSIAAKPGVTPQDLKQRINAVLPQGTKALTGQEAIDKDSKDLKQGLQFFTVFLVAFAFISVFVGAFLIFNTFAMLVAQRTRELALLRALGASRRQITRSVVLEALLVGVLSSVAGFLAGIGVAIGLRGLLNVIGIELPAGDTVIRTRTFVLCMLVGVGVTVLAALLPARRAARVAPVQAMRESGPAEERSLRRRTVVGGVIGLLGAALLATGLAGGSVSSVGIGAGIVFIGVVVLAPVFAGAVVRVLGAPFAALGVPGALGQANAMRSPRRTTSTAAALMIGLALVAAISTLGASAKKSVTAAVSTSLGADFIVHTEQFSPFSPSVTQALLTQKAFSDVAAFRAGEVKIGGQLTGVQGVNPAALQDVLQLDVLSGDLASLGTNSIALSKKQAKALKTKVGDSLKVTWPTTGEQPLTVGAVYDDNPFAGDYLVSDATYDANVRDKQLIVVALKTASGVSLDASRAAVETALQDYPNLKVQDQAEFVKSQASQIDFLLSIIYALLALSILIAILGIINTLALSVVERTRELGLLRAVGLQRRQLKRMIRVESVIIAVFGAFVGVVVGIGFGYALVSVLHDSGVTDFAVPYLRILVMLGIAALGGVLAAALPARRAAKMDVLAAVSST